ncbi:hypothetical protein AB0I61_35415 [Polymorphospora rubra]|uniref:hypothetical protein n=1 Tax=Polymorphospora rubra TaxID=338584 RepID=UPI0033C6642B
MTADIERLNAILDALRGGSVSRARVVQDDILSFRLWSAPDRLWDVRVFSVAWRIQSGARIIIGSDDDASTMRARVGILNGAILAGISVRPENMDSSFDFGDLQLRVFPVTSVVEERFWQQWSVRFPEGECIDIGPGSSWSCRGDARGSL